MTAVTNTGNMTDTALTTLLTNFDAAMTAGLWTFLNGRLQLNFWVGQNGVVTLPPTVQPGGSIIPVSIIKMGGVVTTNPTLDNLVSRVHINGIIALNVMIKAMAQIPTPAYYEPIAGNPFGTVTPFCMSNYAAILATANTGIWTNAAGLYAAIAQEAFYIAKGQKVLDKISVLATVTARNLTNVTGNLCAILNPTNTNSYIYGIIPSSSRYPQNSTVAATYVTVPYTVDLATGDLPVTIDRLYLIAGTKVSS